MIKSNFIILIIGGIGFFVFLILWMLAIEVSPYFLPVGLGLFYFCLGIFHEKLKPNRIAGFRNRWAMKSEAVWYKVHKRSGRLFEIAGILVILLGVWFPQIIVFLVVVPFVSVTIYATLYSYLEYRNEMK